MRPPSMRAALFDARLPVQPSAFPTYPQTIGGPDRDVSAASAIELLRCAIEERFFFDEVTRRISGQRQLRKNDDFRPAVFRGTRGFNHSLGISAQVAYGAVYLPESNSHGDVRCGGRAMNCKPLF